LAGAFGAVAAADSPFRVEELVDGVFLYRPDDGDYTRTNSLVVERSDGLLVVDSQPSPEAARELLAEIGRRHDAPVRYLAYSHDHTESVGGGSAFPAETLVVASEGTQARLEDPEADLGAEVRARAEDPSAWTEPQRRNAVLLVRGAAVLDDPVHPVEFLVLGRKAHSAGDMMLKMAHVELYHVGGLLFTDGNPYGRDANVGYWLGALNHLISDRPKFVVGMRGPALGRKDLIPQRDILAWLRGQAEAGFRKMLPLNRIEDEVLASDGIRERLDMDAEPCFADTVIHVIVEESADERRKRGRPFKEREPAPETGSP
jgi:glyoxylase-like metal-dependent hydrolase (beta-lactamase superfamily II)